jgi:hypothetical protein
MAIRSGQYNVRNRTGVWKKSVISFAVAAAVVIMPVARRRVRMLTRSMFALTGLALACAVSPAFADGWFEGHGERWYAIHRDIYELENRIARLEADPQMDDGYRAPIVEAARREIRRLQASLAPAHWRWTDPCCYSRRPIHIR